MQTGISAEFEITAETALFTDPITKLGGEKMSYPIPTYGALMGAAKNIYFKPTFKWVIEKMRICNPINMFSQGQRLPHYRGGQPDLADYTYLRGVRYQVRAHLVWNENYPEMEADRDTKKHAAILARALERGGRRVITLGPSECVAEVRPCRFGEGEGAYDGFDMTFGVMEHSLTWPDEGWDEESRSNRMAHFWAPVMKNGIIEFCEPKDCPFHKNLDAIRIDAIRKGGKSL